MNKTPNLKKGSTIAIFSPSTPITYDAPYAAEKAETFLKEKGYHVKFGSRYKQSDSSYRSGTARERADELNELIHDDSVDCIMAAAGGYVSVSMLPYIDYEYLKKYPKIIVGHSDVTSVLLAVYRKCGIQTFYGPNFVTSFAHNVYYSDFALAAFEKAVNHQLPCAVDFPEFYTDEVTDWYSGGAEFENRAAKENMIKNSLTTLSHGRATGRLIGGNTDNFSLLYGNPFCPEIKQGDILFLENINETADFFERMIANLYTFGIFNKISGLILGKTKGYDDIDSGKTEWDILKEIIGEPDFPILADADCGHTVPICTLPIGADIELNADDKTITLL